MAGSRNRAGAGPDTEIYYLSRNDPIEGLVLDCKEALQDDALPAYEAQQPRIEAVQRVLPQARKGLYVQNRALVGTVAYPYYAPPESPGSKQSEGLIVPAKGLIVIAVAGLCRAALLYNRNVGVEFNNFAITFMERELDETCQRIAPASFRKAVEGSPMENLEQFLAQTVEVKGDRNKRQKTSQDKQRRAFLLRGQAA